MERVTRVGGRCYFDGSLCRSTPCTRVVCMPNIGSHTAYSTVAVRSTHRTHTRSHTSKAPLSYVLGLNPVTLVAYMQVISYNMPPCALYIYYTIFGEYRSMSDAMLRRKGSSNDADGRPTQIPPLVPQLERFSYWYCKTQNRKRVGLSAARINARICLGFFAVSFLRHWAESATYVGRITQCGGACGSHVRDMSTRIR